MHICRKLLDLTEKSNNQITKIENSALALNSVSFKVQKKNVRFFRSLPMPASMTIHVSTLKNIYMQI